MAPGFHRAGRWLWVVSLLWLSSQNWHWAWELLSASFLSLIYRMTSLCRLSSLWQQQQQSWGKLQKPFHMLAEISLETGIFGEMMQVKGYLFLTFLPEKGLDGGERRGLELEEYSVILSQEIGWGMLFKWRLMLGKPMVCAMCSGKRQDKVWSGSGGSNALKAVDGMKGWSQDTGVQLQLNGITNNQ